MVNGRVSEVSSSPNLFVLLPVRCIPCKGSRYPPTLPRPAVAILPFKLPLCQTTTEKGQMEVNPPEMHGFTPVAVKKKKETVKTQNRGIVSEKNILSSYSFLVL